MTRIGHSFIKEPAAPAKRRWRVVPLRVGACGIWWIIFRDGQRMWRKPTLPEAMDYIGRHL